LLSCFRFPVLECITKGRGSRRLIGLDAYGAVLGLLQVAVLCIGSWTL